MQSFFELTAFVLMILAPCIVASRTPVTADEE